MNVPSELASEGNIMGSILSQVFLYQFILLDVLEALLRTDIKTISTGAEGLIWSCDGALILAIKF